MKFNPPAGGFTDKSAEPCFMEPLRVAVIGAGGMANTVHYPSLTGFDDVEVVACCDLDTGRLAATAERWSIPATFTDYRAMLEAVGPLDAVYAIGQPHQLYDVWTDLLRRGQNLFVEKPLGLTRHQARALAHLAAENGCTTQVGFQRRACPLGRLLWERCTARGPVFHAVCEFYKCEPGKAFLGARDHMMDDGVHAIDTLRWLCGGEVVGVEAMTRRLGVPDINYIAALLHFDTGATGVLLNSWTSGRRVFRVSVHAPGICAEFNPEVGGTLYADGDTTGEAFETKTVAGSDSFHRYAGFAAQHREFLDAIRAKRQPWSHFGDALKTMEVAERILALDRC